MAIFKPYITVEEKQALTGRAWHSGLIITPANGEIQLAQHTLSILTDKSLGFIG